MQAGDIDELLNPGYPVYFNYAGICSEKTPSSLVVIKHCWLHEPSLAAWVTLISKLYSPLVFEYNFILLFSSRIQDRASALKGD